MDINSIANISMAISNYNISQKASISILKNAIDESSENITKLLEGMENLAPLPKSNIDISI